MDGLDVVCWKKLELELGMQMRMRRWMSAWQWALDVWLDFEFERCHVIQSCLHLQCISSRLPKRDGGQLKPPLPLALPWTTFQQQQPRRIPQEYEDSSKLCRHPTETMNATHRGLSSLGWGIVAICSCASPSSRGAGLALVVHGRWMRGCVGARVRCN